MDNINSSYSDFKDKQEKLGSIIRESSDCLKELSMTKFSENLIQLANKVADEKFKIMVVGTFKNGKSTFINSLMGKEVLPAYVRPCTAIINEIKYGDENAVLHFKNPLPKKLPSNLPSSVEEYITKNGKTNLLPLTIPYDKIKDYVCIPKSKDYNEVALESPYAKMELFCHSNLLENGVEIIDSPGLNECETRTEVTTNYLSKVDAILFILKADQICSKTEMDFIEHTLNSYGFTNYFFIVNKFDLIEGENGKEEIIEYAHSRLDKLSKQKIYFISAKDALSGKIKADESLLEKSGVPVLENDLAHYLTTERGKAKLKQSLNELIHILQKKTLNEYIPDQRKFLNYTDVEKFKKDLERENPKLKIARERKDNFIKHFKRRTIVYSKRLASLIKENNKDLVENVGGWVDECSIDEIGAFSCEQERDKAFEKIFNIVSAKIEQEQRDWNNNILRPEMEKSIEDIFDSAKKQVSEFYNIIDSINIGLTGENPDTEAIPTWERIAGTIGGLMIGNISTAISGGINGLSKEFFKTFAIDVGLGIGLAMLGILNPFTAIPAMIGLFLYNSNAAEEKVRKQIKKVVCDYIVKQLIEQSNEIANNMEKGFVKMLSNQADLIIKAMDIEINTILKKVNSTIAEIKKGEKAITQRKKQLDSCEKKIISILDSLQEFNEFIAE